MATSRQLQGQHTKQLILDVIANLLKKKNFDDISIKEICNAANISVGAFYHHFDNKESIIMELYAEVDIYFEEVILPQLIEKDPIESILEYLSRQCQYALDNGINLIQNTYKAQMNNSYAFFLSNNRGLPNGLKLLITRAQEHGIIRQELSTDLLTSELLIISRGVIYNWCVSNGESNLIDTINSIAEKYLKSCMY